MIVYVENGMVVSSHLDMLILRCLWGIQVGGSPTYFGAWIINKPKVWKKSTGIPSNTIESWGINNTVQREGKTAKFRAAKFKTKI